MPSIAQMTSPSPSSLTVKKRKREYSSLADGEIIWSSNDQYINDSSATITSSNNIYTYTHPDTNTSIPFQELERVPNKQRPLKVFIPRDIKRRCTLLSDDDPPSELPPPNPERHPSHYPIDIPELKLQQAAKANLSACHICHQRPRVKSDLDSYADCEGCLRRTCYICIRQCGGEWELANACLEEVERRWGDGEWGVTPEVGVGSEQLEMKMGVGSLGVERHRSMVCSRCAKECGPDGHVRCNGCLGLGWGWVK